MIPLTFLITLLAWAMFAMAAVGLFFWAARWFPRQRWVAPSLLLLFLFLGLFARQSKWAVVVIVLLLVVASGFIPRRRRGYSQVDNGPTTASAKRRKT